MPGGEQTNSIIASSWTRSNGISLKAHLALCQRSEHNVNRSQQYGVAVSDAMRNRHSSDVEKCSAASRWLPAQARRILKLRPCIVIAV
jgi:hypothetical protein